MKLVAPECKFMAILATQTGHYTRPKPDSIRCIGLADTSVFRSGYRFNAFGLEPQPSG